MKKSLLVLTISLISLNSFANILNCTGPNHSAVIDTTKQTLQVLPDMKKAEPAVILDGPEKGLKIVYDQAKTFAIYMGPGEKGYEGNLVSRADSELEETLQCTGSF